MINMDVFRGFLQAIHHLPEMAQPIEMSDAERVNKAKAVMRSKIERSLA